MHMRIAFRSQYTSNRNNANKEIILSTCNMEFPFSVFVRSWFFLPWTSRLAKKGGTNRKPMRKTLTVEYTWCMECEERPLLAKWRTARLYCYFGICWLASAGKCLFYVWTENINIKVIPSKKRKRRRRNTHTKKVNSKKNGKVVWFCVCLLSCRRKSCSL